MLDIQQLRNNANDVKLGLKKRNFDVNIIDQIIDLDAEWRELLQSVEAKQQLKNSVSSEIKSLNGEEKQTKIKEMQDLNSELSVEEARESELKTQIRELMLGIPNMLQDSVPEGTDEEDNVEVRTWGEKRNFNFKPAEHHDILENLGLLDATRATKLSGARFIVTRGMLAKLERALISFMINTHEEEGYEEVSVPFMVNSKTMQGTGQLPKFAEDLFKIEGQDKWLIPTAEVPVTNLYADEILDASLLPINHTAYTPCFRSEAGSAGRDTKGLIRLHQFSKVELVKFTRPEESNNELEKLTANAEKILQLLNIPYRVIVLCSGDTGFSSSKTYDIEVWLPGADKFREISSCSNMKDFQARRANLKFNDGEKTQFMHTLNGSGLAVGRTIAAIVENYQNEDGTISIPDVLKKYM